MTQICVLLIISKGAIQSPLLLAATLTRMMDKSDIEKIVNDYYSGTDKFLVEVKVSPTNNIAIFIDSDSVVKISDCVELSKHIETFFDRNLEDFELEVSSAGISKSFVVPRQYYKNTGKPVAVLVIDGTKIKGILKNVSEREISIDTSPFLSKKQKKEQADTHISISFDKIKEVKIILSF